MGNAACRTGRPDSLGMENMAKYADLFEKEKILPNEKKVVSLHLVLILTKVRSCNLDVTEQVLKNESNGEKQTQKMIHKTLIYSVIIEN